MPRTISVVIPTYNRAKLLAEAVESALQQSRPPDEIIVIDDGSKDNTAQAVARFGRKVRYIQQENAGPAAARNHGVKVASGEFIAFLDSDDLWVKNRLERQLAALEEHPDLDFLLGLEAKFSADEESDSCEIKEVDVLQSLNSIECIIPNPLELLLKENFIPTSSVLLRKSCLATVGSMDAAVQPAEDYDLWIRFALQGFRFGFINAVLCRRRLHEGNLVNQWVTLRLAVTRVLARYLEHSPTQRARVSRRLSELHYDLGSHLLYQREFGRALGHLRQASPHGRTRVVWSAKMAVAWLFSR